MSIHTIEIGSNDRVVIDKLFGPAIFANLRITADTRRGWVVEWQSPSTSQWQEWCIIPADEPEPVIEGGTRIAAASHEHPQPTPSTPAARPHAESGQRASDDPPPRAPRT